MARPIFLRMPVEYSRTSGPLGLVELEHRKQVGGATAHGRRVETAEQAEIGQQLPPGQALGQRQAVRQHPNQGFRPARGRPDVDAEDLRRPRVGPQQADGHRQCRRLAGAVRSEQTEEGARRHAEIDVIDGELLAEGLGEPRQAQGRPRRPDQLAVAHPRSVRRSRHVRCTPHDCCTRHVRHLAVAPHRATPASDAALHIRLYPGSRRDRISRTADWSGGGRRWRVDTRGGCRMMALSGGANMTQTAPADPAVEATQVLPRSTPESLGLDPVRLQQLFALIERHIGEGRYPGAQVAIARHGRLAAFRSFGQAAVSPEAPAEDTTLWLLYSQTKMIVSAAIWQLVDRGALSFSDLIADHLPEFAANGKGEITVHQLLSHQAGFPNARPGPEVWSDHDAAAHVPSAISRWSGSRGRRCSTTGRPRTGSRPC